MHHRQRHSRCTGISWSAAAVPFRLALPNVRDSLLCGLSRLAWIAYNSEPSSDHPCYAT